MQCEQRKEQGPEREVGDVKKGLATRQSRVPAVRSGHGVIANASSPSEPALATSQTKTLYK
jgi:hypothetical protein